MRSICFTAGLIAATNALQLDTEFSKSDMQDFMSFLAENGKNYPNAREFLQRRKAFVKVAKWIK